MRVYATTLLALLYFLQIDATGECGELTYKEWGGLKPLKVEDLPWPVDLVIVQHTVTPECSTDDECAGRVRSIQSYHMEQRHYDNIGPNFLVGGNGKIYEGAGWRHVGTHTHNYNNRSIGLSFIGDFRTKEPTEVALQAAKNLLKCGTEKHHLINEYRLVGHRQVRATESPGASLYNLIVDWPHWTRDLSAELTNLDARSSMPEKTNIIGGTYSGLH